MIWALLIAFQVKHYAADYPLQTTYMLGKFKPWPDCVPPLVTHAAVHGLCTFLIALVVKPELAPFVAVFDFVVHGLMDFVKANPKLLGRWKALSAEEYRALEGVLDMPAGVNIEIDMARTAAERRQRDNQRFWWSLGADQAVHHLTHYAIIWSLL